jgi:hypothetical protein
MTWVCSPTPTVMAVADRINGFVDGVTTPPTSPGTPTGAPYTRPLMVTGALAEGASAPVDAAGVRRAWVWQAREMTPAMRLSRPSYC